MYSCLNVVVGHPHRPAAVGVAGPLDCPPLEEAPETDDAPVISEMSKKPVSCESLFARQLKIGSPPKWFIQHQTYLPVPFINVPNVPLPIAANFSDSFNA